jgi:hypothetical protein
MSKVVKGLFVASLLSFSVQGMAAEVGISTTVTAVLLQLDSTYGGCMAKLSDSPKSSIDGCAPDYVSFNCAGLRNGDVVKAYRMLDQAQLALTTGKPVYVSFRDTLYDGYCESVRIDVKNP